MATRLTETAPQDVFDRALRKINKLKLLQSDCKVLYNRFVVYKGPRDEYITLYDTFTDELYPNKIIDINNNNSGILSFTMVEDAAYQEKTLVYIDKDAKWVYRQFDSKITEGNKEGRFRDTNKPLVLDNNCILCSRLIATSPSSNINDCNIAIFNVTKPTNSYICTWYFVNIRTRTIIGCLDSLELSKVSIESMNKITAKITQMQIFATGEQIMSMWKIIVTDKEIKMERI